MEQSQSLEFGNELQKKKLLNIPSGELPRTPFGSTLPETGISREKLFFNFENEDSVYKPNGP